jgi:hypothetical protein
MKALKIERSIIGFSNINKAAIAATCIVLSACGGGSDDAATDMAAEATQAGGSEARQQALLVTGNWTRVASEGGTFQTTGSQIVRYGANGRYVKKTITGTAVCNTATFGSDPAPGVPNVCDAKTGTTPTTGNAVLTWQASTDSKVTGYKVYYGTSSGSYMQTAGQGISAGNNTTYTVSGLPTGTLYYFAVTAADAAGNESSVSNEANKMIQ